MDASRAVTNATRVSVVEHAIENAQQEIRESERTASEQGVHVVSR